MGKGDKLEISGGPEVWPLTGGLPLLTARMQLLVRGSAASIAAETIKSAKNGRVQVLQPTYDRSAHSIERPPIEIYFVAQCGRRGHKFESPQHWAW